MKASTRFIIAIGAALLLTIGALAAAAGLLSTGDVDITDDTSDSTPQPGLEQLADGDWFGMVTVQRRGDVIWMGIDPAEMLTGEAAHDAAVAAGVITEDEELPNDLFILDEEERTFEHVLDPAAVVRVLDGNQPWIQLDVSGSDLLDLYDGTYGGPPVYGIIPGTPIAMDLTISGGSVTSATAVYLP